MCLERNVLTGPRRSKDQVSGPDAHASGLTGSRRPPSRGRNTLSTCLLTACPSPGHLVTVRVRERGSTSAPSSMSRAPLATTNHVQGTEGGTEDSVHRPSTWEAELAAFLWGPPLPVLLCPLLRKCQEGPSELTVKDCHLVLPGCPRLLPRDQRQPSEGQAFWKADDMGQSCC